MDRISEGAAAGVERQVSLDIVKMPLPGIARAFVGDDSAGSHWGLKISDNYNEFKGAWDFDYVHSFDNAVDAIMMGAVCLALHNQRCRKYGQAHKTYNRV